MLARNANCEKIIPFAFDNMKKKFDFIIILGIICLGAFLRLYRIQDYMTFLGDEGRDVLVVYNILHGHFTLLGPTASVGGFFLGPIYYYFMAPFLWIFNYNPVGPAVMIALFGVLTIWFVYKIGSEFFNKTTGIIAALFYTISPLVISYSHSSWNPNLMPIFTIFTLYTLYNGVKNSDKKLFVLSGIFLGILLQLHYLATFVGVTVFIYVLFTDFVLSKVYKTKKILEYILSSVSKLFLVFVGFIVGLAPYLAFEIRHGFPNTMSIFSFIFNSPDVKTGGNMWYIIQNVFFRLFGRLVTFFPPPEQLSSRPHELISIWYFLTLFLGIASCVYLIYVFYKKFRSKEDFLKISLILIWFFIGIFLFGFYKKSIYDYYFEFLFPLPFLLVGYFVSFLWSKKIYWKIIAVCTIFIISFINLQGVYFRYPANKQLAQAEEISKFVVQKTQNKPYNFALITSGNSDQEYRYFFTIWGKPPVVILNSQEDPQRKSVTDQLLIVCEGPCAPLGNSLWEVAGFGRAEIEDRWNVSVVSVYKLVHYKGPN